MKDHPEILKKIEREVKLKLGMRVKDEPEPTAKAAAGDKK
nr:MetaGeneMark_Unknown Function [uncultured bacterium]